MTRFFTCMVVSYLHVMVWPMMRICPPDPEGSKRNTKAVQNNLDPKWDTEFDFKLSKPIEAKEVLKVIVYDEALFGLRYEGYCIHRTIVICSCGSIEIFGRIGPVTCCTGADVLKVLKLLVFEAECMASVWVLVHVCLVKIVKLVKLHTVLKQWVAYILSIHPLQYNVPTVLACCNLSMASTLLYSC